MKFQLRLLTHYSLVCLCFLMISLTVNSQTIFEKFGGVKTDFKLYSSDLDLEVIDQCLVRRGVRNTRINYENDSAYGYGYESIHFEFVCKKRPQFDLIIDKAAKRKWTFFRLELYNGKNKMFYSVDLSETNLRVYEMEQPDKILNFVYSINMVNIPLILLDQVEKIDITKIKQTRK